ncbi:MAG: dienelactone hydrolase family protein [Clostridia bacterium]|nr:dienelactone hydrolase family protein [Clostridia bacterium]
MIIEKHAENDLIFPFISYISENKTEKPALIIHLHGSGERGKGMEELDRVLVHGLPKCANDENLGNSILVMPQCPIESFWAAKVESIKEFIDKMIELYDADENRIYLCGLSMGGYGTWYTAMAYPQMFAAIAPCCGGGMAWNAGVLKMPVWAFHGLDDDCVSPVQTIEMVEALKGRNPHLKYDLYEGVGHNSWDKAFTPELLKWFFSYSK